MNSIRYYTGLLFTLPMKLMIAFSEYAEEYGLRFDKADGEMDDAPPASFTLRHVGLSYDNPADVIREFIEQSGTDALLRYEETVDDSDGDSLYDIFTSYTFSEGKLTDVETDTILI